LFELAAKVVRKSPELLSLIGIRDTAKQLYCGLHGTLYRALSAESTTAMGLSPVFVVHDELGQVRGPRSKLYEALETAAGAQEEPLSIIISTQAATDADLLSVLIDDAEAGGDPRVKLFMYTADPAIDPFSDEAIRQANPAFDEFMNQDEVRAMAQSAKRMPASEAAYRNLVLNQRIEAVSPFVSQIVWEENGADPSSLNGSDVYGGLDLSSVNDLTALVLIADDGSVHPFCWMPEEGLEEKGRVDKVQYDLWAKQGYLLTTPGRAISYDYVARFLVGIFDRCNVKAIAFDRAYMRFLRPCLERAGITEEQMAKFVEHGQGFIGMTPAIRELEQRLLEKRLKHGNHPVLRMCAANASVVVDDAGSRKFTKKKSTGRIDAMVSLAMACGAGPLAGPVKYTSDRALFL
jgi:phage terminase large subunit-like protein